jgi:hypothetical protein
MPTRRSGVGRICVLATMTALAAFGAPSRRVALAQIPEAPGTFTNSNGVTIGQPPAGSGRRRRGVQAKTPQPTPNPARDTIDEMERAKARASGTPVPQPTSRGVGGTH